MMPAFAQSRRTRARAYGCRRAANQTNNTIVILSPSAAAAMPMLDADVARRYAMPELP